MTIISTGIKERLPSSLRFGRTIIVLKGVKFPERFPNVQLIYINKQVPYMWFQK